jgi:hypothetical protein
MVPAPFRISRSTNSVNSYRQGGQNYISPNNIGKPTPAAKTNSNPYARPLSAKDIVNDLQNQNSQKIKKTVTCPFFRFKLEVTVFCTGGLADKGVSFFCRAGLPDTGVSVFCTGGLADT